MLSNDQVCELARANHDCSPSESSTVCEEPALSEHPRRGNYQSLDFSLFVFLQFLTSSFCLFHGHSRIAWFV